MSKPFAYLEGMELEPDAPIMDNPARLYCPQCRADNRKVCDDPGFCGNLRPMRPLPETEEQQRRWPKLDPAGVKKAVARVRTGIGRTRKPTLSLDHSTGTKPLQSPPPAQRRRYTSEDVFPERMMGRRTTFTQLPDGEEKSWEWFMENITRELGDDEEFAG